MIPIRCHPCLRKYFSLETFLFTTDLVGCQHAVKPRQKLFGAVIRVEHDWDAVEFRHLSDVQGHRHGSRNGGLLLGLLVVDALTGIKGRTAVRRLDQVRK